MKEHALLFGKERTLVGIVTYSDTFLVNRNNKIGILLLNAGLIHHIGSSRIYVKLARKLAKLGFVVMRFDMSGIGDSQASTDNFPREEVVISEAREAMDYLQRNYGVDQFIPIGACAGALAAFIITEKYPRSIGTVLINPLVPSSRQTYHMRAFNYYFKQALYKKASWLKLFTIRVDFKAIWNSISLEIKRKLIPRYVERSETIGVVERLKKVFEAFKERKIKLLIVSSENEIGNQYLKELLGSQFLAMETADLIRSESLAETDHNVTPIKSQNKVIDIVSTWTQDEFGLTEASTNPADGRSTSQARS